MNNYENEKDNFTKVIKMYSTTSNTKIFIDSAYFLFFCFYGLKPSEYEEKYGELPEDVIKDQRFVRLFEKKFIANLYRVSKYFDITFDHIIFVRDCPRSKIWRNENYEEYKQTRSKNCSIKNTNKATGQTTEKKFNIGNLFKYIYNDFMLDKKEKFMIFKFDKLEADDTIAIAVKQLEKNQIKSIIIAEDHDLIQLCSDYTEVYNLMFENMGMKYQHKKLINKIIFGDKSDNITGITSKNNSSNIIEDLINIDLNTFCRNIQLIKFEYIPTKLTIDVIDTIKDIWCL